MRRALIILLGIVILAGGSYVLFTFGGKKPAPASALPDEPATAALPIDNPVTLIDPTPIDEPIPQLIALTSEDSVDYWVNQLDAQAYYVTSEGVIKRADRAGNPTTLTSSTFDGGVDRIVSSPRGDAVIISSASPTKKEFKIYDTERAIWRALPEGTTAAAWSPVSPTNEIAFLSKGSLNIYNLTKGTSRLVMNLTYYDLDIVWTAPSTVILTQRPARDLSGSVWMIDLKQKTMQTLLTGRGGLWTSWQQNTALAFDNQNGSYLFIPPETTTRLPLLALPSKCAQEGLWMFCAVPSDELTRQSLPDAYLQGRVRTTDNFLSLSLAGLPRFDAPTEIYNGEENNIAIDAWHVTKSGSLLYFINRYDGKLYSLKLVP